MINQLLLALGERKQLRPYIMTRAMDSSGGRLTDRDIHAYIVKEGLVSTIFRCNPKCHPNLGQNLFYSYKTKT